MGVDASFQKPMVPETRVFVPGRFLSDDYRPSGSIAPNLLILNQPISDFAVFARLWKNSKYRICADGGANRLYDMFAGELEVRRIDYVLYNASSCKYPMY